jgi:hypothetical protein
VNVKLNATIYFASVRSFERKIERRKTELDQEIVERVIQFSRILKSGVFGLGRRETLAFLFSGISIGARARLQGHQLTAWPGAF